MKPQIAPNSLKPDSILYAYDAFTYEGGRSTVELQQWVVRNIRAMRGSKTFKGISIDTRPLKFVNIICKLDGITCVKGKWKKYIPTHYKRRFIQGGILPPGIYTTKLRALRYAVKKWEEDLIWYPPEIEKDYDDPKHKIELENEYLDAQKELRLLKGQLTKLNNKRLKVIKK